METGGWALGQYWPIRTYCVVRACGRPLLLVRSHFGSNNYWRLGIGRYARIGLYLCAGPPGTPFHHTATTSTENHYHYKYRNENHYRKPLPVPKTIRLLQVPHFGSLLPHHICPRISCQELLRSETQNASASWNVLMQRRRIAWAFTGDPRIHWVHLVMHPVILVGPITADAFVDGLRHNTKLALRVESFIEKWSSRAATASPCIPFRNR